uniref:Uncharacterized protein n=1 Tax=Physcomitrium patens TaxID=3218 RepID=A0A2K1IE67_PHYPA|nr:hypothetical protein PHYPA_029715 [Physcomitrium patens]
MRLCTPSALYNFPTDRSSLVHQRLVAVDLLQWFNSCTKLALTARLVVECRISCCDFCGFREQQACGMRRRGIDQWRRALDPDEIGLHWHCATSVESFLGFRGASLPVSRVSTSHGVRSHLLTVF